MEGRQEGLVLPDSSPWLPADRAAAAAHRHAGASAYHAASAADADCASEACRPVQLRGWLRELASRLECSKEGVVLPRSRERLPQPGRRRVRDFFGTLRLQCRIRQLDARLVGREEGLVLLQQGQGLSSSCWWMCLSSLELSCQSRWPIQVPSSGAIDRTFLAQLRLTQGGWWHHGAGACAIFRRRSLLVHLEGSRRLR